MLELLWFILASIPVVTGLTFVVLGYKQRYEKAVIPEPDKPRRR